LKDQPSVTHKAVVTLYFKFFTKEKNVLFCKEEEYHESRKEGYISFLKKRNIMKTEQEGKFYF
jgi:hypothetical protein